MPHRCTFASVTHPRAIDVPAGADLVSCGVVCCRCLLHEGTGHTAAKRESNAANTHKSLPIMTFCMWLTPFSNSQVHANLYAKGNKQPCPA